MNNYTDKFLIERISYLAIAYVLLWWLATFTHYGISLDVVEGLVWGREWLFATHKHPTLPVWITEIAFQLGGVSGIDLVLPVLQVLSMWVLYLFAKNFVDDKKALLAALLAGISFTWNAFDSPLNHNTAQLIFWVLTIYLFYRALEDRKLYYWVMLAISAAACFLSKYSGAFLLVCMPIWLLAEKSARENLKTFAPYISLAVFLLLIAPNIYFLIAGDFQPVEYANDRSNTRGHSILVFLAQQLLVQSPIIIILALAGFFGVGCFNFNRPITKEEKFILCFAFVPFILFSLSLHFLGYNFHAKWGYNFFLLTGLVAMKFIDGRFNEIKFKKAFYALMILLALTPLAHILEIKLRHHFYDRPSRLHFPQQALSDAVGEIFTRETGVEPKLIVGSSYNAGMVAIGLKSRPQVLVYGDWSISPWVDKKTACRATIVLFSPQAEMSNYKKFLSYCKVKNPKTFYVKVPVKNFPKYRAIDLRMIIVKE